MEIIKETIDTITYVYKQIEYIDKDGKKQIKKRLLHKEYQEETQSGISDVKEQRNGVCVKLLRQPSQWYIDKMSARAVIEADKQVIEDEKNAIRKRITDEKERLSRESLLASGDITKDELDIIDG